MSCATPNWRIFLFPFKRVLKNYHEITWAYIFAPNILVKGQISVSPIYTDKEILIMTSSWFLVEASNLYIQFPLLTHSAFPCPPSHVTLQSTSPLLPRPDFSPVTSLAPTTGNGNYDVTCYIGKLPWWLGNVVSRGLVLICDWWNSRKARKRFN